MKDVARSVFDPDRFVVFLHLAKRQRHGVSLTASRCLGYHRTTHNEQIHFYAGRLMPPRGPITYQHEFQPDTRVPNPLPPEGTWDCQIHVFAAPEDYPLSAERWYDPPAHATFETAQKMHADARYRARRARAAARVRHGFPLAAGVSREEPVLPGNGAHRRQRLGCAVARVARRRRARRPLSLQEHHRARSRGARFRARRRTRHAARLARENSNDRRGFAASRGALPQGADSDRHRPHGDIWK